MIILHEWNYKERDILPVTLRRQGWCERLYYLEISPKFIHAPDLGIICICFANFLIMKNKVGNDPKNTHLLYLWHKVVKWDGYLFKSVEKPTRKFDHATVMKP